MTKRTTATSAAASLADRAADVALAVMAAANLFFLAAFLLTVLLTAREASAAEETACQGRDLLAEIQRRNPGKLARIRAEAATIPNGETLLWRIDVPDGAPSWLFGSMHMADPRVLDMPAPARQAYEAAAVVVIETIDILDPAAMLAAMAQRPELTMFTGQDNLFDHLSEDEARLVKEGLAERGIPVSAVMRMKPWLLSAMVAMPECERLRKAAGMQVLDVRLAKDARAAGKPVLGLETMVEQLEAMASLTLDFHMEALVETLQLGDRLDDAIETLIVLYERGEPAMFWPALRAVLASNSGDEADYAAFEEAMVIARNRSMAERAIPIAGKGGAFIAVGALHLPGEQGLVALLREQGLTLTPVFDP
jgi:uncharacterized protein YbaP (TraB family)